MSTDTALPVGTAAQTAGRTRPAAPPAAITDPPTVHEALCRVREDIGFVPKSDRNTDQGFQFRGIDAVINAAGPVMVRHRVMTYPRVLEIVESQYETRRGTMMNRVRIRVLFTFEGPQGDSREAETWGEAADSGDKAITKAQSVAYRIALLQVLQLPTGEQDPDASSHERAVPGAVPEPSGRDWAAEAAAAVDAEAIRALWRACADTGELTGELRELFTGQARALAAAAPQPVGN